MKRYVMVGLALSLGSVAAGAMLTSKIHHRLAEAAAMASEDAPKTENCAQRALGYIVNPSRRIDEALAAAESGVSESACSSSTHDSSGVAP